MAEYWKSTPKYWCKHCKTFVVDTKLARSQHESTGKHQGALSRFLSSLHRNNERESATKEAAKREVARLEALTSGKPLPSTTTVGAASLGGTTTKWATSTVRSLSEAEKKAQLKQLESLGVSLPEEYRKEVAMPGEWQEVATKSSGDGGKRGTLSSMAKSAGEESKGQAKEEILRKRKAEEEARQWEEMDQDERAMRCFKVEIKTYPGDGFGDDEGPDTDVLLGLGKEKFKTFGRVAQQLQELAEDGKVVKKEEEPLFTGSGVLVKREEGEEGPPVEQKLGGGVEFKKRKVKSSNLRKK